MENGKPDLRERVFARGLGYPNDEELLMLILGSGTKGIPVEKLAANAKEVIDFADRKDLIDRLLEIQGMGLSKAVAIAAAVEFGRRKAQIFNVRVNNPADIIPFIKHYGFKTTEHFITISLSGAREILNEKIVAVGNANSTIISPREVLFEATKVHASSIIIAHNHPSGTCSPSELDIETTEHICMAGGILGISVLDHVILCRDSYFSFKEHGLLH